MNLQQLVTKGRYLLAAALTAAAILVVSCVVPAAPAPAPTPAPKAGIANPASVFCTEKGGQLKIVTDAQGGQSGTCVFPDGSRCEEWAFYRGECKPGQAAAVPPTGELNETILRNAQYELPDLGAIELKDGKYEKKYGEGATQVNTAGYLTAAFGDLNGDRVNDAAAVVWWSGGGSGTFVHLAAMLNEQSAARQAAVIFLGDRTNVEALAIKDGKIIVSVRERLTTTGVEKRYTLQGARLVEEVAASELTGTAWVWQGLFMNNDTSKVPSDPTLYTLTFGADGRASIKADCNMAGGAYKVEGKKLSFGLMATTLAACPPGSLYDEYLKRLGEVESYMLQDGKLILLLKMDSGNMKFAPQQPIASVTGTVSYLPRIALAPDAVIEVSLLDVSKADAPATVIVSQTIQAAGKQAPFPFELKFDPAKIDPKAIYAVWATIKVAGKLAWTSTKSYRVLTQGNPAKVEILVEQMTQPAADATLTKIRYNPATYRCENEPQRTMTEKSWQAYAAPEGGKGNEPVRPGQAVTFGLRNKFGDAAEQYESAALVIAPDGGTTTVSGLLKAADWLYLTYPKDFAGAKPTVAGDYTVVWQIKGGYVTCSGFQVVAAQ